MKKYQILSGTLGLTLIMLMIFSAVSIAQVLPNEYRTIDGTDNNINNPSWGSTGIQLLRMVREDYSDGISEPAGATRKSPREISNMIAAQDELILNSLGASDFIWQWGQFLDHDIDLTTVVDEPFPITVPTGDPYFDPDFTGNQLIGFNRSVFDLNTGDNPINPRQQINEITSFIDASNVYGSDAVRANALRTNDGTGMLKTTSGGKFLPFNEEGLPNAGGDSNTKLFLAGDIRANEQIALTAMHTLFVREHNRLCKEMAGSGLDGETIYQRARKIIGAQIQVITYKEFLPLLLGPNAIPVYRGYNDRVNPAIANEFSGAAYRFGHSMLSPTLLRYNKVEKNMVHTELKDAFFNPLLIYKGGGLKSILLGLATQQAQEVDNMLVDAVRNFLFGDPGEGGFDLASANIQRGRDHGLADYNTVRQANGLTPLSAFSEITTEKDVQEMLAKAYNSVDDIDLWVGSLAEDHIPGTFMGETLNAILVDQFTRLRDGDRFWYQNDLFFSGAQLNEIENTTLADIIRRNTYLDDELSDDVFRVNK
jgi:hypothetical protein